MAKVSEAEVRGAIAASSPNPNNKEALALAVRISLDWLAQEFPGSAVELRVPPFRVVQLLDGVNHRRGTPPAVVEIGPRTWIDLLSHKLDWESASEQGMISASGEQSDLAKLIVDFN